MQDSHRPLGPEATRGASVALLVALLTGLVPAPAGLASGTTFEPPGPSVNPSGVGVSIDPATWWMVAGNTTELAASWYGVPAGCSDRPLWYRWTVASGWTVGVLSPSNDSFANFTANSVSSGEASVVLRAASLVRCSANETVEVRNTTASVTVVVPPILGPLTLAPNPISAGNFSNLTGSLADGEPPYHLVVDWGDGNVSSVNLSLPGSFALSHRFGPGNYTPRVSVLDAAGLAADRSVEEPVYVSPDLAVAVDPAAPVAEVGLPMTFTEQLLDPPSNYSSAVACTDALAAPGTAVRIHGSGANFTCTFAQPGAAQVDCEIIPVDDDLPVVTAELDLPVTAPLAVNVSTPGPTGEVGTPSSFRVTIGGGVPPFRLSWQTVGNATSESATLATDGGVVVPAWPSGPGTYSVAAQVDDALGVLVANRSALLDIDPSLNASALLSTATVLNGTWTSVSGAVSQGAAPFAWFVFPGVVPTNGSPENGTLSSVAEFAWAGLLGGEGSCPVFVGVVDRDGGWWSALVSARLVPVLQVTATIAVVVLNNSSQLDLSIEISGGLPPFELWANSSPDGRWNASTDSDGASTWPLTAGGTGSVEMTVVVEDRLGARWSATLIANGTGSVSPPPSPGPPPRPGGATASAGGGTWPETAGASIVVLGVAAVGALFWRRRSKSRPTSSKSSPDPVATLREIIRPSDGVDRATVELLAGEAGVDPHVAGAAIDRLVADGTLRSETGDDGEEVLSWSDLDA